MIAPASLFCNDLRFDVVTAKFEFEGSELLRFYLHGLLGFQFKVSGSTVGIIKGDCLIFQAYRL